MSTTTGTNAAVSTGVNSLGSDGGFFQSNFGTNNGIKLRSTATGIGQLQAWSGAAFVNTIQVTGSTQAVLMPGALTVTGGVTGAVTGNASTATALQTARAINGVNFDGTGAITVTAAAGTLSGSTLAAGVTASSLTSFGSSIALGTPASGVATNLTGTATALNIGGNAATATTASAVAAANLTGNTLAAGVTASSLTSTGALTPGGNLTMGTNSITMTGSLAATGSRVTKGWFTDIESTNAPTIGGVAASGTGGLARLISPTFTGTPILSTASATSINFGEQSLANYKEAAWTPTDNSGAGLSLTVTQATYTRIGRVVFITANITYPTTASGASASLAGLPFTILASSACSQVFQTSASLAGLVAFTAGATTATLLQVVGSAAITNLNLTGATVKFSGYYFV